jgi:4,4'-diaponeurosporenoate glycosyltransferase
MLTALVLWQAWAYRLASRHYRALPSVEHSTPAHVPDASAPPELTGTTQSGEPLPISVIIPARNEATNLPPLLASLATQHPGAAQVIVVDDQSGDATAAVAESAGATVVRSPGPPPGWIGKTYACHLGARAASQPWLLFLDADTSVGSDGLRTALDYAKQHELDGLSLLLQQRCVSFWERLLLPYAYAHYFAGARRTLGVANGQWILIGRAAYARCGGHEAVKGSIIDDVALAQRCHQCGVQLRLARGESLAQVHMYDGLRDIWRGFSKNAFRFVAADPAGGMITVASAIAGATAPLLVWNAWKRGGRFRGLSTIASYAVASRGLIFWHRLFRAGNLATLHPIAALTFQMIAMNSALRTVLGRGAQWKGRVYR